MPNRKRERSRLGPPILNEIIANMAPSWLTISSQNGEKVDANIIQKMMLNFGTMLQDFGRGNGNLSDPKSEHKSM